MAGLGKRMRPHTLTTPKPLIPIAGKPIVHRLVEDIAKVCGQRVEEVAFIIHPSFGAEAEKNLILVAEKIGAKGSIFYQTEALGTAHAIMCAKDALVGNVVVAFADTLFKADFTLDANKDGIIWVQKIDNPSAFGVVKLNENQEITDFVEKPTTFVSDLAIIGIYYFKDGEYLRKNLQYLLDNNIREKGEYQLTNALENMKGEGAKFAIGEVHDWLDCGNKDVTVQTNARYLEFLKSANAELVAKSAKIINSVIIEPVFIGENAVIENTVLGPHVSVGAGTKIVGSVVSNAIIQENTQIKNANITNTMLGNFVVLEETSKEMSLGDYSNVLK